MSTQSSKIVDEPIDPQMALQNHVSETRTRWYIDHKGRRVYVCDNGIVLTETGTEPVLKEPVKDLVYQVRVPEEGFID